jgi:hypothetical protein
MTAHLGPQPVYTYKTFLRSCVTLFSFFTVGPVAANAFTLFRFPSCGPGALLLPLPFRAWCLPVGTLVYDRYILLVAFNLGP